MSGSEFSSGHGSSRYSDSDWNQSDFDNEHGQKVDRAVASFAEAIADRGGDNTLVGFAAAVEGDAPIDSAVWLSVSDDGQESRNAITNSFREVSVGLDDDVKRGLADHVAESMFKAYRDGMASAVSKEFDSEQTSIDPESYQAIRESALVLTGDRVARDERRLSDSLVEEGVLTLQFNDPGRRHFLSESDSWAQSITHEYGFGESYDEARNEEGESHRAVLRHRAEKLVECFTNQVSGDFKIQDEMGVVSLDDFRDSPELVDRLVDFRRDMASGDWELLRDRITIGSLGEEALQGKGNYDYQASLDSHQDLDDWIVEANEVMGDGAVSNMTERLSQSGNEFSVMLADHIRRDGQEDAGQEPTEWVKNMCRDGWEEKGIEFVVEVFEYYRDVACGISSESSRKLLDKITNAFSESVDWQTRNLVTDDVVVASYLGKLEESGYQVVDPAGYMEMVKQVGGQQAHDVSYAGRYREYLLDNDVDGFVEQIRLDDSGIDRFNEAVADGMPDYTYSDGYNMVGREASWERGQVVLQEFTSYLSENNVGYTGGFMGGTRWEDLLRDRDLMEGFMAFSESVPPGDAGRLAVALAGYPPPRDYD